MKKIRTRNGFRAQVAQGIAELQGIMARGESPTANGRLTVRHIGVAAPSEYDAKAIKATRARLNVSQGVFAELIGVSPVLVRSWERGVRTPAPVARRLLDQVCENPSRFLSLLHAA